MYGLGLGFGLGLGLELGLGLGLGLGSISCITMSRTLMLQLTLLKELEFAFCIPPMGKKHILCCQKTTFNVLGLSSFMNMRVFIRHCNKWLSNKGLQRLPGKQGVTEVAWEARGYRVRPIWTYMYCSITPHLNFSLQVRRHVRPHFQETEMLKKVYGVITFIATRVALSYCVFAFILLQFWLAIDIYR